MQNPTRESEPSDYQQLYRKHVHENMVLRERLKSMDTVEKHKMRELNNDAAMFRGKYMKYIQNKQKLLQEFNTGKGDTKQCRHRSAYLICKDFAYPAKTWHDLVDVSKSGLDLYKTEILKNTVGERPESNPRTSTTIHRNSAGILNVYNLPSETSRSNKASPRKAENDTVDHGKSCVKYELEKLKTIPSIVVSDGERRSSTLPVGPGQANVVKCKSENNLYTDGLPPINQTSATESGTYRGRCHTISTPSGRINQMHNGQGRHVVEQVSPRLSPRDLARSLSSTTENDESSFDEPQHRERCHTISNPYKPDRNLERRRSYTDSSNTIPAPLLERRRSCSRRHSTVSSTNEIGTGWCKLKQKVKMISVSLSLLHDARQIEIDKTAKSFEDLRHCRYLRLSDDKSLNEGLDNFTYSRDRLHSSSEDL